MFKQWVSSIAVQSLYNRKMNLHQKQCHYRGTFGAFLKPLPLVKCQLCALSSFISHETLRAKSSSERLSLQSISDKTSWNGDSTHLISQNLLPVWGNLINRCARGSSTAREHLPKWLDLERRIETPQPAIKQASVALCATSTLGECGHSQTPCYGPIWPAHYSTHFLCSDPAPKQTSNRDAFDINQSKHA